MITTQRSNPSLSLRAFFLSASVGVAGMFLAGANDARAESISFRPDQLLVKPAAGLSNADWRALEKAHGLQAEGEIPAIGVRMVKVPAERRERVLEALSRNPNIEFVEPDYDAQLLLAPNDARYSDQWHLPRIAAPAAWDVTAGRADQVIAIIDTGVRANHSDLNGKVLPGYNFIGNNTHSEDDHGHGTMVAGAAAAIGNNGEGIAGVAWENWILPIKSLDAAGSGSHSTIANGIIYAADNGARVINLSLGSTSGSRTLKSAVDYAWSKNSVLIAAAGNSGDGTTHYPAAYPNVIGVSALDSNDNPPSWATYGDHVSISAPGVSIWSTHQNGSYAAWSGSSFAAPLVAGAAGLVLAVHPSLNNVDVVDILEASADDLGPSGYDVYYGHGRLNATAAVTAGGGSETPDTTPPSVSIVSPENGAVISGAVEVQVDAYDDVGVEKVELFLNGTLVAQSTRQVISFSWDTTTQPDGDHRLEAKAYDAAGNTGTSTAATVTVSNSTDDSEALPLSVAILSPTQGERISKMVKIEVETSGGNETRLIELYINGSLYASATSSPARFNWNVNKERSGEHTLQVVAHDSNGSGAESEMVKVIK